MKLYPYLVLTYCENLTFSSNDRWVVICDRCNVTK